MSDFKPVYSGIDYTIYSMGGEAYIARNRVHAVKWRVPRTLVHIFELEHTLGGWRVDIYAVLDLPIDPGPITISLDVAEALAEFYGVEFVVKSGGYTFKMI